MAAIRQRAGSAATHAEREQRRKLENMFDPQVLERMREEFSAADADGSGSIDTEEAAAMLGRLQGGAGSSPEELRRSAEALMRTIDVDRNHQIDFEEFCFRFGRRYQWR
jgi:Ca2+-binding EF-hand superfamily protein